MLFCRSFPGEEGRDAVHPITRRVRKDSRPRAGGAAGLTSHTGMDQLTAKVFQHCRHLSVELAVAIEDQILGCTIFREGLSQLLHDPGTGGMCGDVEVQDSATAVSDYEKAVQYPEGRGGHGEKVHGGDSLTMILEKGEPALAGVSRRGPLRQVAGDGGLGDYEAQLQELTVDPGSTPSRIFGRHRSDE